MTETISSASPPSLLDGVEEALCHSLGIRRLRHRSAMKCLRVGAEIDIAQMVFDAVAGNWSASGASENINRSRQNWRWTLQPKIGAANFSPEVMLERAIAQACAAGELTDWANQIPVASGLVAGATDGRRAIDLAQRLNTCSYEMIELKIASDTPLYAAIELLGYASLWLLARAEPPATEPEFLKANELRLRVLAPEAYYAPFRLVELEATIQKGITLLGKKNSVSMSFEFDVLPQALATIPLPAGNVLLTELARRRPLHGN